MRGEMGESERGDGRERREMGEKECTNFSMLL